MDTNNIYKILVVESGEKVDFRTENILDKPRSVSNTYVKAAVLPGGELNLTGMIKVNRGAVGAQAFLKQNVLLLGENSRATAIPELEIETDEVKASHAATVGQLDGEQLYYLESRGIEENRAKKMLVMAFLEDILPKIDKNEAKLIRDKIEKWTP